MARSLIRSAPSQSISSPSSTYEHCSAGNKGKHFIFKSQQAWLPNDGLLKWARAWGFLFHQLINPPMRSYSEGIMRVRPRSHIVHGPFLSLLLLSLSPPLLFLSPYSLSVFSHHCHPPWCFHHDTSIKTMEPISHGPNLLKPWANINLFSIKLLCSRIHVEEPQWWKSDQHSSCRLE